MLKCNEYMLNTILDRKGVFLKSSMFCDPLNSNQHRVGIGYSEVNFSASSIINDYFLSEFITLL